MSDAPANMTPLHAALRAVHRHRKSDDVMNVFLAVVAADKRAAAVELAAWLAHWDVRVDASGQDDPGFLLGAQMAADAFTEQQFGQPVGALPGASWDAADVTAQSIALCAVLALYALVAVGVDKQRAADVLMAAYAPQAGGGDRG